MDELAAAFMAKLVSGNLQQIDEATTHRSATDGRANKIDVGGFISNMQRPQATHQQQIAIQNDNNITMPAQAVQEASANYREVAHKHKPSRVSVKSRETFNDDELLNAIKSIDKTLKTISTSLKKLIETK